MTQPLNVQIPGPKLTTKSGHEVKIGTGSGTKWQKIKKGRDPSKRGDLLPEAIDYLVDAINNGFRHIDTAEIYTTHPEVAAAIAKSDVPREDLFVATKYNPGVEPQPATFDSAAAWVDASLKELGLDYLDSILIHFPFFNPKFSKGQTVESVWKDLIEAKKAGKVRYIGVSNFGVEHLKELFKVAGGDPEFYPAVNQIEFHPYLQNQSPGIVKFSHENNILVEAYGPLSPLFRVVKDGEEVKDHPLTKVLPQIAEKHGRAESQILLRYTLQKGILPITTSSKSERQIEALAIYEFALSDEEVAQIDKAGSEFEFRGFFLGFF
ncbi:hypothetical protein FT663_02061 [Candidozyma haemuli var. vulneris]|uniref:2-dehydropantolactone reductase n=1 Tax=Candidozyma haemuli TaxID=45357 RepID=A0A2V1AKZ4_9ASCO|nr:hypothetical protein CXQ85_001281 [[Candida] haemuloni]KAF3989960.1 hypothetical protein FT662_02524 [[Candida] haemuloni var. vulneris]KAF3993052.1 hypothetical protein FT663_02061 [[Candida] haemuloni var. vulneris]PVH18987.1 hypothetical protein CXQ85_001281 [[Candida] haemuloni]